MFWEEGSSSPPLFIERFSLFFLQISDILVRDYAGKGYATQFVTLQKSLYITTFVCVLGGGFFLATALFIESFSLFFFQISDILARDYAGKGYATEFVTLQKSLYIMTFVCVLGGGFFLATAIYRTFLSIFLPDLRHLGARLCREGLRHSVCNTTEVAVHNDLRLRTRRRVLPRYCAIYRKGQSGSTETNTW